MAEMNARTDYGEPWRLNHAVIPTELDGPVNDVMIFDKGNAIITQWRYATELDLMDARRIVTCVNACAGIPTEALENHRFVSSEYLKHLLTSPIPQSPDQNSK